jgi:hypothetical protein
MLFNHLTCNARDTITWADWKAWSYWVWMILFLDHQCNIDYANVWETYPKFF